MLLTALRQSARPSKVSACASKTTAGAAAARFRSDVPSGPKKALEVDTSVRPAGDVVAAAPSSGAPEQLLQRSVRIFMPSPPSTQSGKGTSHHWRVDWDILQGSSKFENTLMGWTASADYVQATHLKFKSKEDAIHFCEKQGWPYFIQEPARAKFVPKSYASNYFYRSPKDGLRIHHTK